MNQLVSLIEKSAKVSAPQVEATLQLLQSGFTVPYIAKFEKEKTGDLRLSQVKKINELNTQFVEISQRKEVVKKAIQENDSLTSEIEKRINDCWNREDLEEIYLPFRPKRKKTSYSDFEKPLTVALHKILEQKDEVEGTAFLSGEEALKKMVPYFEPVAAECEDIQNADEAMIHFKGLFSDWLMAHPEVRTKLKKIAYQKGEISCEQEASKAAASNQNKISKYKPYFKFREKISNLIENRGVYRYLIIRKGKLDKVLKVNIHLPEQEMLDLLMESVIKNPKAVVTYYLQERIKDAFETKIKPHLETELRSKLKAEADKVAIEIFQKNLRRVLLQPPYHDKKVVSAFVTPQNGIHLVLLDESGSYVSHSTFTGKEDAGEFEKGLAETIKTQNVDLVGVCSTNSFRPWINRMRSALRDAKVNAQVLVVNDMGLLNVAYNDHTLKEFPQFDPEIRQTIETGRRLQDPMNQLCKVEPENFLLGPYQNDVNSQVLKASLKEILEEVVHYVGVDINRSNAQVLKYLPELPSELADSLLKIIKFKGPFQSLNQLREMEGMTDEVFERVAPFTRIESSEFPLDQTKIHPKHYEQVNQWLQELNTTAEKLISDASVLDQVDLKKWAESGLSRVTCQDILMELRRIGKDPRLSERSITFNNGTQDFKEVKKDDTLEGVVTNVTRFGAFVDIGFEQDGLIHLSELSDSWVADPLHVVAIGERVKVKVLTIDHEKGQFNLTIKPFIQRPSKSKQSQSKQRQKPQGKSFDKTRPRKDKKKFSKGPGRSGKGKPQGQRKKKPSQPFNNPFADALKNFGDS